MTLLRTIKVFISSSTSELGSERRELVYSISQDIGNLFEKDNILVSFVSSDDAAIVTCGRFQDSIIQSLDSCDVSLFLFKCKAGQYTIQELEMAREFQKERNHKVFVYFLHVPEKEKTKEIKNLQKRLYTEEVYWRECENIMEVKYDFALQLLNYEGICNAESDMKSDKDIEQIEIAKMQLDKTRKNEHQSVENILVKIEAIKSIPTGSISENISQIIEFYKKADQLASKTDYDKRKHYNLLTDYAGFLKDYGMYSNAEKVCVRLIAMAKDLYGTESEVLATSYNNLGEVYHNQGDYSRALEYHIKALKIDEEVLGIDHHKTAIDYNNIGSVYDEIGSYHEAKEYYQKALAIKEKIFGMEHPDTATSYNNLGMIYYSLKDYTRALEYNQKALSIFEKYYGTDHPATATSYGNIGLVYHAYGDYLKALEYFQKALAIRKLTLGEIHPDTAVSYNNIGMVYKNQGNPIAKDYIQKATTIREKNIVQ